MIVFDHLSSSVRFLFNNKQQTVLFLDFVSRYRVTLVKVGFQDYLDGYLNRIWTDFVCYDLTSRMIQDNALKAIGNHVCSASFLSISIDVHVIDQRHNEFFIYLGLWFGCSFIHSLWNDVLHNGYHH